MKCYICKKEFYDKDRDGLPNEYVALFDTTNGRTHAHLFCFLNKQTNLDKTLNTSKT